jgi:diadenylate cyclase
MNLLDDWFGDLTARSVAITAIDIFIVYYVIYRVLLTIKGTRAAQMVIGIVVIGASFFVAERLEMTTVSWLLDNFISYFIIIIIVVFQQDIRRGLMRLGQRVGPFSRPHALAHAMDEVLKAADRMAKARIGGIVVFEREAELGDFLEHGETVDANVSSELLVTLFLPSRDNELHDGAVIIDKNLRAARAGAVLPLSRNDRLARQLGTRHRAALGITEETDAVAVVVSEERGEISLCFRGGIARDLEVDQLRSALQGLFVGDKHDRARVATEAEAAAEIARAMSGFAAAEVADDLTSSESRRATTVTGRAATSRPMEELP